MHFGTGAIIFVAFVTLYLSVLWFQRPSRSAIRYASGTR
jgi:hypothetical protein